MRRVLLVASLGALVLGFSTATAALHPSEYRGCSGQPSAFPVNRAPPTLIRTVPNGKRFLAGQGNDTFHVGHLYGSHYEMGVAHGQLFGEFFPQLWDKLITYVEAEIEKEVPGVEPWLADLVAIIGVPAALQLTVDWTSPFTPKEYIDEMRGMADGSGYPFEKIWMANLFPELIKAACTVVGATGASTPNGRIAHLRDLDFPPTMPVRDTPMVTVLHGNGTQTPVANFGWVMVIGSLTGISQHGIGIGEKVWDNHDQYDGVKGQPWMFILRDVLYQQNLQDALATMQKANRTCAIHVGLGDGNENKFRGVTMAQKAFEVWNWSSIDYPQHPILQDVMYWDKHDQPSHHWCLSTVLKSMYGNLSAETLATVVSPIGETGSMHSVAFDYGQMTAYYANARKSNTTVGGLNAYSRQYTYLDLNALFAEPKPQA